MTKLWRRYPTRARTNKIRRGGERAVEYRAHFRASWALTKTSWIDDAVRSGSIGLATNVRVSGERIDPLPQVRQMGEFRRAPVGYEHDDGSYLWMAVGWRFESDDARHAHDRRRDFIRHLAIHASSESDLGAAELIYGELVGNVVRHAGGRVRIVLEWSLTYAVLRVRDYGSGFVHNFDLPSMTSESGRGLFIVRTLARTLEVKRHPVGSEVHVTLPVRQAA